MGDTTDGNPVGGWSSSNPTSISSTSLDVGHYDQIFSESNPNLQNYVVTTNIRLLDIGNQDRSPKYGVYGAYINRDNYYLAMIDSTVCAKPGCVATNAVVNGIEQGWQNCTLPAGFNPTSANLLVVEAASGTFNLAVNGSPLVGACQNRRFSFTAGQRPTYWSNGQIGVVVEDTEAEYTPFNVSYGLPQDSAASGQAYAFRNQASRMNLDNQCDGCGGQPGQTAPVIQYPGAAPFPLILSTTQRWTLKSQNNGSFAIVSTASGLCLESVSGQEASSSASEPQVSGLLRQVSCNGEAGQNWKFIPTGRSNFVIQNQASSLALESADSEQGSQVRLASRVAGSLSQQWRLIVQ